MMTIPAIPLPAPTLSATAAAVARTRTRVAAAAAAAAAAVAPEPFPARSSSRAMTTRGAVRGDHKKKQWKRGSPSPSPASDVLSLHDLHHYCLFNHYNYNSYYYGTTTTTTTLTTNKPFAGSQVSAQRRFGFWASKRKDDTMASATSFFDFKPLDKRGQPYPLPTLKGKVILIVNTASKCGFTPQFAGLETLYKETRADHGDDFVILGFPCNQFGNQDPGSNDTIQEFCQLNYGVSFPVLGKVDVNGDKAEPLFEWLKKEMPGLMGLKRVKWNFEKFLVGRDGSVKGRWASTTKPEALRDVIEKELAAPKP